MQWPISYGCADPGADRPQGRSPQAREVPPLRDVGVFALMIFGAYGITIARAECAKTKRPSQSRPHTTTESRAESRTGTCRGCGCEFLLDQQERCSLCAEIERAVIDHYGFGSYPWGELRS